MVIDVDEQRPASDTSSGAEPTPAARSGFARMRANLGAKTVLTTTAVALVVLVVFPLVMLVWGSFTLGQAEVTISSYTRVFVEPRLYTAMLNTLYIAVGTTVLSLAGGIPLAWIIARTNVPGRGWFRLMTIAAFVTPAYQGAIAYMMLMGPNAGYMNRWLVAATNLEQGPFNIFSLWGIIFVTTINTFPYVVFLCAAALTSVDPRLEQSAQILGASRLRMLTGITWKLVTPAILSSSLLVFVHSMSLFGSHAFLGLPRGIYTLPTRIYTMFGFPPDYAGAASMSMILVLVTVALLFVQRRFLAKRSYITMGGKGVRTEPMQLSRTARSSLAVGAHLLFALAVYFPVGVLLVASLSDNRALPISLENFSLRHYDDVLFGIGLARRGIVNSIYLGIGAATIGTLMGGLIAYMSIRLRTRGVRILDYLSMIPMGLPGVVLAVALIIAWIRVPIAIYATAWILLIAYVTKTIPLAMRAADSSIRQLDPSLENAARVSGASWLRSMFDVTLPLMRGGLLAAWSLIFIQAAQELAASILLFTPGNETVAVAIFQRVEDGLMEQVAALSVVVLVITIVVLAVANRVSGGRVAERIG